MVPYLMADRLRNVPKRLWSDLAEKMMRPPEQVWMCASLAVYVYPPLNGARRLSFHRPELADPTRELSAENRWRDQITWDEIQRAKRDIGFGDQWALEAYPADEHVINVANMRHVWLVDEAPAWAWRNRGGEANRAL
jgi:hypothetical protein